MEDDMDKTHAQRKQFKLKMQYEVRKAIVANNGDILSKSEHEAIVSEIKIEITKAHVEVMEAQNKGTDEKWSYEASRTKNLLSETDGCTYWELKGYADDFNIFLRDVEIWDESLYSERRYTIDVEQGKD